MAAEATARSAAASRTEQRAYWFYGDLVVVHVSGEETDGRFSLLEWIQPPGEQTPVHVHKHSDQTVYVLEGELTLHFPGKTVVVGPGECAHGPMGVPHTEHVTSAEPVRLVEVNSPGGFENFVAALGEPAAEFALPDQPLPLPEAEELIGVAAEYDIEVLGPPGQLP
jgi:mannose-6-phosphate isomerase-like protein (cupin superfamily)